MWASHVNVMCCPLLLWPLIVEQYSTALIVHHCGNYIVKVTIHLSPHILIACSELWLSQWHVMDASHYYMNCNWGECANLVTETTIILFLISWSLGAGLVLTLQKKTWYFCNCICHQNCNCDMVVRDDARSLWQPSMGNVGNAALVKYSNNWNLLYVQRSLPLIGHFNHTVITLGLLWFQTNCIGHLPGSWSRFPHWQVWEHPQGHYNYVFMEIFMPWWQQMTP